MPSYVIHLAVGKVYEENNKINNIQEFEKGIIAPDLAEDKSKSHYGPYSSQPNFKKYIKQNKTFNEYKEGYFLHLVTDYLFYNRFLAKWDSSIYDDYDRLNQILMEKYKVIVPPEIQNVVKYKEGKTNVIDEYKLYKFINTVGRIDIRKILSKKDINFKDDEWVKI